ncbi:MAG TPA: hypothetical protein VKY38_09230 [Azoarcus sp.]|nr:hypothetical protein [Azoarcus sp.]
MKPDTVDNGTVREINGIRRVFYDGYWIKVYDPPADSLKEKRVLIEALTRRLFNHVEHGINVPGYRLGEARASYEAETLPERRRIKGAMLAGALFNHTTDIFTQLVDAQAKGEAIPADHPLLEECGRCLQEALELGRLVLHRSGEEGIDELWGEPCRAFSISIEDFYASRYVKIAQALRCIDQITTTMRRSFDSSPLFQGIGKEISVLATSAKAKCETLRTDSTIFEIWTDFVVAGEHLAAFSPQRMPGSTPQQSQLIADGKQLIVRGRNLISDIARARVAMPKSKRDYIAQCEAWAARSQIWIKQ